MPRLDVATRPGRIAGLLQRPHGTVLARLGKPFSGGPPEILTIRGFLSWHVACPMMAAMKRRAAPRASLPATSANGTRPERALPRIPARILVIEDHRDTRELLEMLLRTEGYEVTLAADGEDGIAAYRRQQADVVLVDIFMPRKDGIATITELRRDFPDAVIIAMSADTSVDRRGALGRAREAGAHLTLRKPIEPWVLLRSLEGVLAGRRSLAVANG